jgi:hypothetical protein
MTRKRNKKKNPPSYQARNHMVRKRLCTGLPSPRERISVILGETKQKEADGRDQLEAGYGGKGLALWDFHFCETTKERREARRL